MARKPKVLAVDDKLANQLGLDAVLGADCDLIFAYSGEEALELLAAQRDIDLILMDVQMPGMDGFETAALIKEMEGAKDIPIIFRHSHLHRGSVRQEELRRRRDRLLRQALRP